MRWQYSSGYSPSIYRWSKWPASYHILAKFCWLITETLLAYLFQSGCPPFPLFFFKDNRQYIVQSAKQLIGCQLPFKKQPHSVKRKQSPGRTATDPAHSGNQNLPLGYGIPALMSWWCLRHLPTYLWLSVFLVSVHSVFIQQARWFQRTSRFSSLRDWLCHLPPASTAVQHLFINALGACRGFCDT